MTITAATKPTVIRVSISSVPGEWGAKARPSYTRALMRSPSRPSPALRVALRAGAAGAVAAAFAVPLLRRRARIPAAATVAACAFGPLAVAVLRPRTPRRDIALFAMQMWAFTMAHELPFDDPDRLRARLRGVGLLDRGLTWVHWLWFLEPYCGLLYILRRHPERFPRAARRLAAVF